MKDLSELDGPLPSEPFVRSRKVQEHLGGISRGTLEKLDGAGMPVYRVGIQRMYRLSEVDAWVVARERGVAS